MSISVEAVSVIRILTPTHPAAPACYPRAAGATASPSSLQTLHEGVLKPPAVDALARDATSHPLAPAPDHGYSVPVVALLSSHSQGGTSWRNVCSSSDSESGARQLSSDRAWKPAGSGGET